jgi:hypothetical protein
MADEERTAGAAPGLDSVLAGLDAASPLLERLVQAEAALARERTAAPVLAAELLALSREEQEEAARREPRFRTWGVCEGLLRRSAAETEAGQTGEAARLAALALSLTARLDGAVHPAALVQDLEAQAWACVGAARLAAGTPGDLSGAEAALREAAARLAHGTGDLLVEARLLDFEAALRGRQGRAREAAALRRQAAARYREVGETGHD